MFSRALLRCSRPRAAAAVNCRAYLRRPTRRYSTSSPPSSSPVAQQSLASLLGTITTELDKISPRFEVKPTQIQIFQTPTEFYEALKSRILKAQRRVYLSTLYIGKTEHELIATIREALQRNPELKVSFLTDALRGTRETPKPTTASLLAPLVADFGSDRVEIRMFHTPNLTGFRKSIVPRRINEGWGLQHMKLYGIDDELILSGANLSTNYFTDRQDRYHLFSSREITDYFHKIQEAVSSLSYRIRPNDADSSGYKMEWPSSNKGPAPLDNPKAFRKHANDTLAPIIAPPSNPPTASTSATHIYPLLQFTPLLSPDTSTELPALTSLLQILATPTFANSRWTFTAGYFNMTPHFRRLLLATRPSHGTVIAASPHANGFYGSKGVSGMLPDAYTLLARRFVQAVRRSGLSDNIELKEWKRGIVDQPGGWTYHAKGLWVTLPGEDEEKKGPSVSVIGSSNYTKRSYGLDLEANVMIVTGDDGLKAKLKAEETWLQEYAKTVDESEFKKPERKVGISVRLAMWVVTVLGGAL